MRYLALVLCFYFTVSSIHAYSTEASKFAASEYAGKYNCKKVHINSKKEHNGNSYLKTLKGMPIVTYGWGDMKIKNCKKQRITYIVMSDESNNFVWSTIKFFK